MLPLNYLMNKEEILSPPKTVAIVGLSDHPGKPSRNVAHYLLRQGFTIIPVNPNMADFHGLKAYPSLSDIPHPENIDIVDVFRRPEAVMEIVDEIIKLGILPVLWFQEEVVAPEAKAKAEKAGMTVIMDECMKKEHEKLR